MTARKAVLLIVLAIVLVPCVYSVSSIGFGLDAASAQDAAFGQGSVQLAGDLRATVSDEFQIRVPLALSMCDGSMLFEAGMQIVYYPWFKGPFMSLSLFQLGFSSQCENLDNIVNLNEVSIGWTFTFGPGIFVEPSLVVRDPSGTFSDEYSSLKGTFPCYTSFRGRLVVGWFFWR